LTLNANNRREGSRPARRISESQRAILKGNNLVTEKSYSSAAGSSTFGEEKKKGIS
jgi:hypothetical protein